MELVERIARALAKADKKDPDAPAWVRYPGAEPFGICWRDQYADKARACLAEIEAAGMVVVPREPTREMIMAAYSSSDDLRLARFKWEAMINVAASKQG